MITGMPSLKPKRFRPWARSPFRISGRMGVPVYRPLGPASLAASGKVQHITVAKGAVSLLANPGVMSDSWHTMGTWFNFAPYTTGTETNPPLENTTFGFSLCTSRRAWSTPRITLKGSEKFFTSKYRRSLPQETA